MIDVTGVIIAGVAGATVFSMFAGFARTMGMTKMSIEKILGGMFGKGTGAAVAGWIMHYMSSIIFAVIYVLIFNFLVTTNGWFHGAVIGLVHGIMFGAIILPMMGIMHPAIKSGDIEAPGFFGVNAGSKTPIVIIVGQIIFGAILGGTYFMVT
jgi:hypothetical protein